MQGNIVICQYKVFILVFTKIGIGDEINTIFVNF